MVAVKTVSTNTFDLSLREQKPFDALAGFIFVCNNFTVPNLERKIFGLPLQYVESVQAIHEGLPLFLFNYSTRYLHGIFEAASNGGFNLDPHAWGQLDPIKTAGRYLGSISKYPAQVRVRVSIQRPPLNEKTFRPVLDHYEGHKFKLELTADQVHRLLRLFGVSGLSRGMDERYNRLCLEALPYRDVSFPVLGSKADLDGYSECSSRDASFEMDEWVDDACLQEPVPNCLNYHCDCQACFCGNSPVPWGYQFPVNDYGFVNGQHHIVHCKHSSQKPELNRKVESPLFTPKDQIYNMLQETNFSTHNSTHCVYVSNELQIGATSMLGSLLEPNFLNANNIIYAPQPGQQNVSVKSGEQTLQSCYSKQFGESELSVNKQVVDCGNSYKEKSTYVSELYEPAYRQQMSLLLSHSIQSGPFVPLALQRASMGPPFVPSSTQRCLSIAQSVTSSVENLTEGFWQSGVFKIQNMQLRCQTPVMFIPSGIPASLPQFTTTLLEGLHLDILQFARQTRPSLETIVPVEAAIICVQDAVRSLWPEADVEVFGSFATGLSLQHSDVDLAVVGAPLVVSFGKLSSTQMSAFLIKELAGAVTDYEWCESHKVVANATVPVLKCVCRPLGRLWGSFVDSPVVAIDITVAGRKNEREIYNQPKKVNKGPRIGKFGLHHTGGAAREFVLNKICELPALAPLVLLLKVFLQHRGLNNVYSGGLGSFALILLVIYYLEWVPVSSLVAEKESFDESSLTELLWCKSWDESCCYQYQGMPLKHVRGNALIRRAAAIVDRVLTFLDSNSFTALGTLLLGFLHTFGALLDLSHEKIVLKGKDGSLGGLFKRDNPHIALWIDDPLCPGMNVGAGSYAMCQVQDAFRDMLEAFINQQVPATPLHCTENTCLDLDVMSGLLHLSLLV